MSKTATPTSFRFLGDVHRKNISTSPPEVRGLRLPQTSPGKLAVSPPNGSLFQAGDVIGPYDDERTVRCLKADPRFEEVI